jgi:hypothetical protein
LRAILIVLEAVRINLKELNFLAKALCCLRFRIGGDRLVAGFRFWYFFQESIDTVASTKRLVLIWARSANASQALGR